YILAWRYDPNSQDVETRRQLGQARAILREDYERLVKARWCPRIIARLREGRKSLGPVSAGVSAPPAPSRSMASRDGNPCNHPRTPPKAQQENKGVPGDKAEPDAGATPPPVEREYPYCYSVGHLLLVFLGFIFTGAIGVFALIHEMQPDDSPVFLFRFIRLEG